MEARHELRLGLGKVERRPVRLRDARDEEDEERGPLRPDVPVGNEAEDAGHLLQHRDPVEHGHVPDASRLRGDDVLRRKAAGDEDDRNERKAERDLVRDELRRGTDPAEQWVLRARGPAGEDDPVHAQRPHREEVQETDVEVAEDEVHSAVTDRDVVADRDDRERQERGDHRGDGSQRVGPAIRVLRPEVLLEKQLDAVRQRLRKPERTVAVRPETRLHEGEDPALEPDHQHRDHEQNQKDDDHLDGRDDHRRPDPVDDVADHAGPTVTVGSSPEMRRFAGRPTWSYGTKTAPLATSPITARTVKLVPFASSVTS